MVKFSKITLFNKLIIVLIVLIIVAIGFYVYQNNQYTITLLGESEVNLFLNDIYNEAGYTAYDRNGNDVSRNVKVSGNVNTTTIGTYKIKYQIGGVKTYRIVNVKYNEQLDITLSLLGNEEDYILKDSEYVPLGCNAIDLVDGDISSRIMVDNNVNPSVVGEYEVLYTVTNSRGVTKSISRKVIVYDVEYSLEEKMIDGNYVVTLKFNDEFYQKVKLPDGTFSLFKEIEYSFFENGDYTFEIYDQYNNVKKIPLKVTKVDKTAPTGTCVVNLYDSSSKVTVNATDDNKIKGYVYSYGTKKSELLSDNSFTYTDLVSDVEVVVYDANNNNTTLKCSVKDSSTSYTRSYTIENGSYDYKLYIPPTLTKRNKLPLVIFLHGMGECGGSVNMVDANSFPKYISQGMNFDFVMIAPHLTTNLCKQLVPSRVMTIIDAVVAKYPIDTHRIIVTGFSLGAINTFKMIKAYPTFFAGAIPVAEKTTYEDTLLQTNIWAFIGTRDSNCNILKNLMNKVILGNPNSKFTTYEGGHNITAKVYQNKDVINWIMNAYR